MYAAGEKLTLAVDFRTYPFLSLWFRFSVALPLVSQSMQGEYGYLPRVAHQRSTGENVPETGSMFWFSIPLREAVSSLDAAVGTALGLDDDEREVVGSDMTDLRLSTQPRPPQFY